jgi:hypothetical protein
VRSSILTPCLLAAVALIPFAPAFAQTAGSAAAPGIVPPAPTLPVTFVRGEDGRSTIRAVRLRESIVVDGRLDEEVYTTIQPASDFIQQEPTAGEPATEKTEIWIFFDERNVYISFRCFDSRPDRIVANEMRRDNNNIFQNDNVTLVLDTFYDRRTAFFFQTNPLGGLRDALVIGENLTNYDWNTVWDVRTRRVEDGWVGEMAIPFKSLRYPRTQSQIWGFNVRRTVRSKNESSFLGPAPRSYGQGALQNLSFASTLVGIEPPGAARNLELKPAAISNLTTNRLSAPPVTNDLDGSFSFDAKYGVTSSMTVDFTANTDFAQVEIDEQQVNLTRFSLFFPEKRDFFLEGQSVFDFAGSGGGNQGDTPIVFFSRRIGLSGNQLVPILAGGRLTGRAGRYSVGVLEIGTREAPSANALATNFLVARVKRDILARSSVGLIATQRTPSLAGSGSNSVYGVDANLAFFQNVQVNSYYARSRTPGVSGDDQSYRGQFRYAADRYGLEVERMKVGPLFRPEVGFVRRPDVTKSSLLARFSPRPRSLPAVRKFTWELGYDRFVTSGGILETRLLQGTFRTEFASSDVFGVNYFDNHEFLESPFPIVPGVTLPVGAYGFGDAQLSYQLGPQRRVSGTFAVRAGAFYSGDHVSASYSGRVKLTSQLAVEPRVAIDKVTLPEGRFTTTLAGGRTTYTLNPRMFISALVQYNSSTSTLETNARFRWEYQPGSDLFVVYTDGRDTAGPMVAELVNRGVAVKFTRLWRF